MIAADEIRDLRAAQAYRADVDPGGTYGRPESVLWWLFGLTLFFAPLVAAVLWVTR